MSVDIDDTIEDSATEPAPTRANWSAIAKDLPQTTAGLGEGRRISQEGRDALLKSSGYNPANFSEPAPLPELPRGAYAEQAATGYGETAEQLMYKNMSDFDKIRYAVLRGGPHSSDVQNITSDLYEQKTQKDIDSIAYPEGDVEKIAKGLAPGPVQIPREYVEELDKTPEGKQSLRDLWVKTQTDRVQYANSLEYQMYQAGAVAADTSALAADFRRMAEDTYGGKRRAALNLGKDFVYGVANTGKDIGLGIAGYGLDALNLLRPGTEFQALRSHGPMTREEMERFENPPIAEAQTAIAEADEAMSNALYRAPARTGNFVYDKLASPLASGAGSMVPFLASGGAPFWMRLAASTGAARQDVYRTVIDYGGTPETASLLSVVAAPLSGAIEILGMDSIFKAWRTPSPYGQLARNVAVAALGEGGEEFGQSIIASAAGEVGTAMEGSYTFNPDRIWSAIGNAAIEGGYGAILGGGFGAAGSGPVRTAFKHIDYRNFQRFIDGGVERLQRMPDIKKNTEAVKHLTDDIIAKSGAQETAYIDAAAFVQFFQGDIDRMRSAMVDMDVTQQQLDAAREAGAQIEVSTSGLMRHVAANEQNIELKQWAQSSPDAPTVGILVQEAQIEAESAAEFAAIREANEPLPDPFKVFRQQIMDAGNSAEDAQYVTDVHYALAKTAAKRMGITPEQFLDLNPVQVILAKGIERARSYGDIATQAEERIVNRDIRSAAQSMLAQSEIKPMQENSEQSIQRGAEAISAMIESNQDIPAAMSRPGLGSISFIWGKPGDPERQYRGGYGISHILEKHGREVLEQMPRVIANGGVIREYGPENAKRIDIGLDGHTAVISKFRDGEKETWLLTGWKEDSSDGAEGVNPGRVYAPAPSGIQGQAGAEESTGTIPVEGANVKQWNQEAIDTILRQVNIAPEQADAFVLFAQSVVEQGGDLSNAEALADEFVTATYAAEGLEQAAAGIQRILNDPAAISQALLDAAGIEAATPQEGMAELQQRMGDLNRRAQTYREFHTSPETRQLVQATVAGLTDAGKRGDVTIAPDINTIRLFNGRQDRSTIVHELYHLYNNHLVNAVKREGAAPQLVADVNTLNEAAGGGLDSFDMDIRRASEEKAASMFEKYMSEGKAPSPGLADAFRRFRTWMANIYRGVKEFAEIELTPEVRGVFDRMLATDEEIGQARAFYHDVETLAAPSGATPEQAAEIGARAKRARMSTEERQHAKTLNEFLGGAAGRKALRRQAGEEVARMRLYQAADALRKMGGLSFDDVANEIGDIEAKRLQENHRGIIRESPKEAKSNREGGIVGATLAAENFGYASVQNMLADISAAPNARIEAKNLYDQKVAEADALVRLAEEQGSATAVDEAYHNDDLSRAMAAKQAVLDEQAHAQARNEGRRTHRQLTNMALKRIAYDAVSAMPGRKNGGYFTAVAAYRKHAEAAARADAAGDKITAAKEYQQVRLNHYVIQESIQARKDVERFARRNTSVNDWIRRLEGKKQHADAPVKEEYRNVIKDVATTFKVVASARMRPVFENGPGATIAVPGPVDVEVASLAPSLAEYIPEWIINREGADKIKSWKDLTVGQIRELGDALDTLTEQGRGAMRALRMPGLMTVQQQIDESIKRMKKRDARPSRYGRGGDRDSRGDAARNWFDSFLSKGIVPEYLLAIADGNSNITGGGVGPLQNIAITFRQKLGEKNTMFVRDMRALQPAMRTFREFARRFKNIDKKRLSPIPEGLRQSYGFKLEWDGEMAVMVALNVGTANNLKAITQGYGMNQAQINQILSVFTSAELNAVQQVWDVVGSHFEEIDAVHYSLYNKHVQREQAQSMTITTADGEVKTLSGGYFPLLYDGTVDRNIGAVQDAEVNLNRGSMNAVRGKPQVGKGMTIARVGAAHPPILKLDAIATHLDKTAQFIHLAEAVKEANAITNDKMWSDMFISRFGEERYRRVRDYIKYVADPDSHNLGQNDVARRALNWLRGKATTAALGFRVKTALKQRLDTVPAIQHMSLHSRTGASGFKYWLMGVRDIGFAGNIGLMNERIQEIHAKSSFMRDTEGNITADMRDLLSKARGDDRTLNIAGREITWEGVYNTAFMVMTSQDRAARASVWAGAYKMAMSGDGDFDADALRAKGTSEAEIDKLAIKFADGVAATFSATTAADLTAWQADKGLMNLFTTFLTGTVRRSSRLYQYIDAFRQGQMSAPQFAKAFAMDAAIQAWIPAFLAMGIKAVLSDDDDDEITAGGIMFDMLFDPMLSVIDGVPLFNAGASMIRYKRGDVLVPAGISEFTRRFNRTVSIKKNIEKGEWHKAAWKGATLFGYLYGVPFENIEREGMQALEALGIGEPEKKKRR